MIRLSRLKEESADIGKELFGDLEAYQDPESKKYSSYLLNYLQDYIKSPEKDTEFEEEALKQIIHYIHVNVADNQKFVVMLEKLKPLKSKYPHILKVPANVKYAYRGRSGFSLSEVLNNTDFHDISTKSFNTYGQSGKIVIFASSVDVPVRRGFNSFSTSLSIARNFETIEAGTGSGASLNLIVPYFIKNLTDNVKTSYPVLSIESNILTTLENLEYNLAGISVIQGSDPNLILNPNFMNNATEGYEESEVFYLGDKYTTYMIACTMQGYSRFSAKSLAKTLMNSMDVKTSSKTDVDSLEKEIKDTLEKVLYSKNLKVANLSFLLLKILSK